MPFQFIKKLFNTSTEEDPSSFQMVYIEDISSRGFTTDTEGEIRSILWNDVLDVHFENENKRLVLKTNADSIKLDDDAENWFFLLDKIPRRFQNYNRDYIEAVKRIRTTCKICGSIAVYEHHCLSCDEDAFSAGTSEFATETEYVHHKQLDLHACIDEEEFEEIGDFDTYFELEEDEDDFFKVDMSWRPSFTKEELYEYSKNTFWYTG